MDWTQFKQTLSDDLRPNALDAMNPYVTVNAVMPMVEYQAAEIDRLKAELELRDKVIEQADLKNRFDVIQDRIYENYQDGDYYTDKEKCPELFAHLAGRGGVMFEFGKSYRILTVWEDGSKGIHSTWADYDEAERAFDSLESTATCRYFLCELKPEVIKFHRPTPEGLVQVWPEVKDA